MTIDPDKDLVETVQVALRIRPLIDTEITRGCQLCLETIPNEPQVHLKGIAFTYNYVFPPEVSQATFYDEAIKNLVNKLHKGYNVTILAYGQTGSGKTYSMGTSYADSLGDAGVIPRAVSDIFEYINENSDKFEFKVKVSFMELYQEQLFDLLSTKPRDKSIIDIREDQKGIVLPNLTEEKVTSAEETMTCLVRGSEGRATGATAMNVKSSRSHAIFTIHIFKENKQDRNQSTTSKFHLVDLAGSERSKKTKATGNRFKEGVKINQGLLALGNVISALGDGSNRGFVCYRDSKLTRLLQDSLGGNSMTLMIACVSPADYNLEETLSTLRYADRARHIHNKPIVNQDPNAAEILRLNGIIQQLRLQILNEGGGAPLDYCKLKEELEEEKLKNITLSEKYAEVIAKNKNLTNMLQKSISDHTGMVERALVAEASKDKVERKLVELTEECNQTIEMLKENCDKNNRTATDDALDTICKMRSKIIDVQTEQKDCSQKILDLINDEPDVKYEINSDTNEQTNSPQNLNESDMNDKEEAYAIGQVARNNQLKDLIKSMAEKMNLAEKLSANNQDLISFNESVKESKNKINLLEKEKEELLQQLKSAQLKSKLDPSIINERKTKIQVLENEIADLRKKCVQQANLIKIKEKNDLKINTLNNEIQQMKAAKVKLVRAMRSENDRFRAWKLQNEKQLAKLSNQDRKMQNAIVQMENKFTKQQIVLKRKMEEAVATNKRLKEALERQKNTKKQRNVNAAGKAEIVQHWIEEELELMGSLGAAKRTLDGLMEDRGTLTVQLEKLKTENPNDTSIETLQEDIQLRNAQIADLQQKILAGEEENKNKMKWDTVQSMVDAKCALKYLFDVAIEAKREVMNFKFKDEREDSKYDELKELYKDVSTKVNELEEELSKVNYRHRIELSEMDKQHEEKVSTLIKQLSCVKTESDDSSPNRNLLDRLEILQDAFERAQLKKAELEAENVVLRRENENPRNKPRKKLDKKNRVIDENEVKIVWDEPIEDTDDDSFNDPDWIKTPLQKRSVNKLRGMFGIEDQPAVVKRNSEGQTKCSCKTKCSSKQCSCRKLGVSCGSHCKCSSEICVNQGPLNDNTNSSKNDDTSSGTDNIDHTNKTFKIESEYDSDDLIKKPRIFNNENDSNVVNRDKRRLPKRSFFYHDSSAE